MRPPPTADDSEMQRVGDRNDPPTAGEIVLELVNLRPRQDVVAIEKILDAEREVTPARLVGDAEIEQRIAVGAFEAALADVDLAPEQRRLAEGQIALVGESPRHGRAELVRADVGYALLDIQRP